MQSGWHLLLQLRKPVEIKKVTFLGDILHSEAKNNRQPLFGNCRNIDSAKDLKLPKTH